MLAIEGDSTRGMGWRFIFALEDNRYKQAKDILEKIEDQNGKNSFWRRSVLLAHQGQFDSARHLMNKHAIKNLYLYHLLGMKNELYHRLEEIIDSDVAQRQNSYPYWTKRFYLETYRDDPEFQRIIGKGKKLHDEYLEKVQDMMVYVE